MSKLPMVNIGGDEKDASYRYKMPSLITKVEGRGNGIKTILVNITDVCKAMHTEPQYATRFFGIECGAVSKWDEKRDAGIVHGVHERHELQKSLKKFVREFILCPKCRLPELQMKVQTKKSILMIRCGACGHKGRNNSTHKVKTYIINHPPTSKSKSGVSKQKSKDKRGKKSSRNTETKDDSNDLAKQQMSDINQLGGEDDNIWTVDVSDEAVARRKHEEMQTFANGTHGNNTTSKPKSETKEQETKTNDNNDNDNGSDNDSDDPDAKIASKIDPYRSSNGITNGNNSGTTADDSGPAQILRSFMNEKPREIYEILDEIKRLGLAHNLDDAKQFKTTFEATCKFDTCKKLITSLKKNQKLFCQLNKKDKDSIIFFGCLEEIIARRNPDLLLPKTYMILEAIYDLEIASEEQILNWYNTESDKALLLLRDEAEQVRKKAQPFIKWLEEADEDDDDNDDEDDDDEDTVDIE